MGGMSFAKTRTPPGIPNGAGSREPSCTGLGQLPEGSGWQTLWARQRFLTGRPARASPPVHPTSPIGQAFATEAIAECIRSGGVWEAESNIDLLDLPSTPPAADWDASLTVERINF
jgi:hypothetical protein